MRADRIIVDPFTFDSIQELELVKEINDHAKATICGILDKDTDEKLLERISPNEVITIKISAMDGEEVILFRGLIGRISLRADSGVRVLRLSAYSHTCLMDKDKKIRIFQDTGCRFKDLAKYIGAENQSRVICTEGKEEKTDRLIVQYQETDWEFLKRMASIIHTVIVADNINGRVSFSLGMPEIRKSEIGEVLCQTARTFEKNLLENGKRKEYIKDGVFVLQVETREVLELCTPVSVQGREYVICSVKSQLQGEELVNTYELAGMRSIETPEKVNNGISGVSLDGVVHQVSQDHLQIRFPQDVDQPAIWFPYATVYSSPDGTGWYCMPEEGDSVRVYFPDSDERKAVAINSIHLTCGLRENPEIKYIRSSHKKEIRFEPSAIRITNNQGISVILDDKKGITLESDTDIMAMAGGNIDIHSGKALNLIGDKGIIIQQGDNKIQVKDGIRQTAKVIRQR